MNYNIILETFQGPMDLLLHLIEKSKLDIYDIPIYKITDQYLDYIEKMKILDLNVTSEFLVMAATLLEIKSKNLLPKSTGYNDDSDGCEIDSEEELLNRLIEYKKFKSLSKLLGELEKEQLDVFYKPKEDLSCYDNNEDFILDLDIQVIANLFYEFINKSDINYKVNLVEVYKEDYNVEDYINRLIGIIDINPKLKISSLINKGKNKKEVIVIFLSILELIRMGKIYLIKNKEDTEPLIAIKESR